MQRSVDKIGEPEPQWIHLHHGLHIYDSVNILEEKVRLKELKYQNVSWKTVFHSNSYISKT